MFDILLGMGKVKVCIVLREDILDGFKSRGLTNLSGVIEELLSAFLSSLPPEYRRRGAKETRELARRFLEGRPVQESPIGQQELLQQLMTLLQTLQTPSQPSQTFRPQPQQTFQSPPSPQPQYQPPSQPKPKVQEQKPRISAKEFLRAIREHAIEHGVPPELVDYERILEEARREAQEEEEGK
uniref:Uncharacterized protein n=1 Tax=Thermocrinis ruber TaxID=75906 RepID=A0A7C5WYE6_9AQUI